MKRVIAGCTALMFLASLAVTPAAAMTTADEYGWYDNATNPYEGNTYTGDGGPNCGAGTKTVCKTISTSICVEWQSTSATLGAGPTSVTISVGTTCKTTKVVMTYYYFP